MFNKQNAARLILAIGGIAVFSSVASAHPHHQHSGSGWAEGLLHPLLGVDHLLAMVATGLLAAQFGRAALWAIPASFVGSMVVGGICGMNGVPLPAVELGIALSIVLLGVALAINRKQPLAVPLAAVALFGFYHGHAHGTEVPSQATPLVYALGFVATTIALHALGVILGRWAVASTQGRLALRFSGAAIAGAGLMFLVR